MVIGQSIQNTCGYLKESKKKYMYIHIGQMKSIFIDNQLEQK